MQSIESLRFSTVDGDDIIDSLNDREDEEIAADGPFEKSCNALADIKFSPLRLQRPKQNLTIVRAATFNDDHQNYDED